MNVLGAAEQEAIQAVLSTLEYDVDVTLELGPTATPVTLLAAGGREIDSNAMTRDVVSAVCVLGTLQHSVTSTPAARSEEAVGARGVVRLEIVEHEAAGPWPRTTIGPGLRYLGMPLGYELTTLVHGILEAGRREPSLTESSRARLASLDRDVAIDVYVTPT